MTDDDPGAATQAELAEDAAAAGDDPHTRREAMEQELIAEGASEEGETIGDEMP